jgi:hypothetical protein
VDDPLLTKDEVLFELREFLRKHGAGDVVFLDDGAGMRLSQLLLILNIIREKFAVTERV